VGNGLFEPILQCVPRYIATSLVTVIVIISLLLTTAGFQRRLCVCLFVCLFFSTRYLKNDAARITKLDVEMFIIIIIIIIRFVKRHHESWKLIYFRVKKSKFKVTRLKNNTGVCHGALVSAGFY